MNLKYILIFCLFLFIHHFSAKDENMNRCVQKIHNKILKDEPKIEQFCGLEGSEYKRLLGEFGKTFTKYKSDLQKRLEEEVSEFENFFKSLDGIGESWTYHYPYNVLSKNYLAMKTHFDTDYQANKIFGDEIGTYFRRNKLISIKDDTYWKVFRTWCHYTVFKNIIQRSFFLNGCLSKCILDGEEKEFHYKFYYAKPYKNFFIIKEDLNKQTRNSHNFYLQFFVDNHKEFPSDYRCDAEHLLGRYRREYIPHLHHQSAFENVIFGYGNIDEVYHIDIGNGYICEKGTVAYNCSYYVPSTFSIEADLLPQMPPEFGVFIILAHNCSPGRGKIYQLIKIGKFISNDRNQDKVQVTDTISIKLEKSADNKNYAFDSLTRIRKLNNQNAGKSLKEVNEMGEKEMHNVKKDAPYMQFKTKNV